MQYTVCNGYFTKSTRIYNLSHYLGFFTSICEELRYDGVLNCDKSHNMRLYTTERKLCYHKSQSPHLACVNSPALCRINAGGDNAGMPQNVSETAQITLQRVKRRANRWRKLWGKTFSGATPALSHRPFISRQIFDRSNGLPVRVVNTTPAVFFCFSHIVPKKLTQFVRQEHHTPFAFAADLDPAVLYGLNGNKAQF